MVRLNCHLVQRPWKSSDGGPDESVWISQVPRVLALSETISPSEREKFIKLWELYEPLVELLDSHGLLSQRGQQQYRRIPQIIRGTDSSV
ncbi:hypothetical protein RSOLAG22IIIB_05750 [Rhizoctonia solani]|uniref:Uncharacterized protein n=1 Tax=Rhizoctonia solani TaxID=456999 RepID=A0A0K6G894_9AGAM|nr:hypothetical protein RSOLAG22IIIB_05750 [Rhizoctonia solani]